MKFHKPAFIAGILLACFSQAYAQDTIRKQVDLYSHGLSGDLRVHDPVMIRQGQTYYVYGTGISVKKSKNRIHWQHVQSVFPAGSELPWWKNDIPDQDGHLWAPDIQYRNGLYHLYYAVSAWMNFNSSIGYATNTTLDPEDPNYHWTDHGKVIDFRNGGEGVNVIDPNVFADEDGKVWLLYGSFKAGLRMLELDPRTGMLLHPHAQPVLITTHMGEGGYIIKGPQYYYIFASAGRCCAGLNSTYHVLMGRSKKVTGPYLNKEGQSWKDDHGSLFLQGDFDEPGRGHNGFFAEGDTTFVVYHAYTRSAQGQSLLNIRPLYITADGWPSVEDTGKLFQMAPFERKVYQGK